MQEIIYTIYYGKPEDFGTENFSEENIYDQYETEAEAVAEARQLQGPVFVEKALFEVDDVGMHPVEDDKLGEIIYVSEGNESEEAVEEEDPDELHQDFPKADIEDIDEIDDAEYAEMARQYEEDPADWIDDNKLMKEAVEALEENESEVECKGCFDLFPKEDCIKTEQGYMCPKCAQELHSHQGTNLDLIDKDPFDLEYDDPRDFDEPEEAEVKEEPVDANEVRKFEAGIEEKLEEHVNDRPADIESNQELQGTDNAVVDCEVAKVIAHSEDEKPLDCKMEKPALEEPLAGEEVNVKVNEDLSEEEAKELDKEVKTLEEELKVIIDFSEYKPWSGAVDTYNLIKDADKLDELESYLEDIYPDGITATQINDILWFDSDQVLSYLGLGDAEDEEVDESLKEAVLDENIFTTIGKGFAKLGKNISKVAKDIFNYDDPNTRMDNYVKEVLQNKEYKVLWRDRSKGDDYSDENSKSGFKSIEEAEAYAKNESKKDFDAKVIITNDDNTTTPIIFYRDGEMVKDNKKDFLETVKKVMDRESLAPKDDEVKNTEKSVEEKPTEEKAEEKPAEEKQKRDMSKQNKARADYKKLTKALQILNVDPKVLRTEDGKVTPEFKELRKVLFAESLIEENEDDEDLCIDIEEALKEAKKEDELPVDPEAAKLEVHTMLNDLVADGIDAINGYEEAKAEIMDTPIAHKDNILDTIDHVEDEAKEHVDELISATTEIPFDKKEAPAPVVEEPVVEEPIVEEEPMVEEGYEDPFDQDFPKNEEKPLVEVAAPTPFDSDVKVGDKIKIGHLEGEGSEYDGKEGEVTNIDSIGQLHGTWGGLAIIPGVDDFNIINEDLNEAKAKPEADKEKTYNDGLKLAKLHNKPVIYGYTNKSYGGKFFALDDPIVCNSVSDETKKFKQQYKSCGTVYVAYPDKDFAESLKLSEGLDLEDNKPEVFTPEEQEEYSCDEDGNCLNSHDTLHHCGWCGEIYPETEMRHEVDFGWICSKCEDALKSQGGPLMFIENKELDK